MSFATLDSLRNGQDGIVLLLDVSDALRHRLAALGVTVGKTVRVLRRAGWAGPLHLRAGMTEFVLRQNEARQIQLQPLTQEP
jgi:ferrous iron transport protein A